MHQQHSDTSSFLHIKETHNTVRLEVKAPRSASPVRKPRKVPAANSPTKRRSFKVGGINPPPLSAAPATSAGQDHGAPSNGSQVGGPLLLQAFLCAASRCTFWAA